MVKKWKVHFCGVVSLLKTGCDRLKLLKMLKEKNT